VNRKEELELEAVLARLVCAGRMPLADAQRAMATDWAAARLPAASAQTPSHTPPAGMMCPGDKLVWVNTRSGVYHFQGECYFGSTKRGKFICERDADKECDRPTHNGL
jgi:hypothetical protein